MRRFGNDTQASTPTDYGGNNAFNSFPQSRTRNQLQSSSIHSKTHFKQTNPSQRIPLSINRSKLSIPFKSQLCLRFQSGKCYYGENCHFSHRKSEIRNPAGLNRVAIGRHLNYIMDSTEADKTRCFWCSTGEVCPYGGKCLYKGDNKVTSDRSGSVQIECKTLDAPQAYYFNQVRKKNNLCMNWERFGRCAYGDKCIFAHGKAELQQLGSAAEMAHQYTPKTKLAASQPNYKPSHEMGIDVADDRLQPTDQRRFLKWDIEKMSGIYADWIGDTHNLHFR